jgi:2-oxoglutarate dehydrogenase complex dehydrogenase (E1) component-like enzyme
MHAIPYCSDTQLVARLTAKHVHADAKPLTKAERRAWRIRRREFKAEQRIALCKWGRVAMFGGVEL